MDRHHSLPDRPYPSTAGASVASPKGWAREEETSVG